MGQDSGVDGRDRVKNQGFGIAPSIGFGLNTPTRIYLYSQHLRQDNVPDGGIPTIGMEGFYNATAALRNGAKVRRENYYGGEHDYEKVNADMFTAKVEHDLTPRTRVQNLTRYGKSSMDPGDRHQHAGRADARGPGDVDREPLAAAGQPDQRSTW